MLLTQRGATFISRPTLRPFSVAYTEKLENHLTHAVMRRREQLQCRKQNFSLIRFSDNVLCVMTGRER